MSGFTDLADASEVPLGRVKSFAVDGRTIAVYHVDEGYFATDNSCPHRGGPLAEGDLIANEIICPWHLWGFDVETGICGGNREVSVATHEVRIEGGRIQVKLS